MGRKMDSNMSIYKSGPGDGWMGESPGCVTQPISLDLDSV
jgi:hypothetical protein